jgi:ADP-ribose pyrophosphatase YjhB (NUDIX family)
VNTEIPDILHKVVAYITRERGGRRELLVFRHRDFPDAGVQVPAGTVNDGEAIEDALAREVLEETGLAGVDIVRKLGVFHYRHPVTKRLHVRNVFHLRAAPDTPDAWEWTETSGGHAPEEEWYVFCFYWADLAGHIELAGHQADYLTEL